MSEDQSRPPWQPDETEAESDPTPKRTHERIGPYTVIGVLGQGGMGIVYVAEQTEPVTRRVALKVIKHGMDTKQVIARFEAERQAVALMDHPAIAKIYDAGTTFDGRPYFAMEYVKGVPITEHCDREKLTNRERLELFIQVCEGVQHAHHKAVIHRDLKPSNVLVSVVDGRAAVKIIDFGVAKAVAQRLTERTLYTELGVMIGTPEYMSPEQAEMTGQDVDTRSDVYSLGVMLYELLVGALPFESKELRKAGFDEIRRRIREDEPPRPSVRLSTLGDRSTESARRRRTEPKALRRELLGDLDWITMRALEKDRARRYGSPADLAADIGRQLRLEPVLAHAPSTRYRAWKFVRRHRMGVVAAAVMLVGLLAGTVGSTVGFVRARRAEAHAVREVQAKRQVADFLKNLFKVSNPSESRGNRITARELLDKAAGTIDTQLADQPVVRAELAAIMGEVYDGLGLYGSAETLTTKALDIRKRVLGPEHPDTLESMSSLAQSYWRRGRFPEAERLNSETLEIRKRVLGPEHPDTVGSMNRLANVWQVQGRYPEAERLYSQALELRKRVLGPEHRDTLATMSNLANVWKSQGRYPEAERLYSETLEIRKRVLGPEHPDTLATLHNLANVWQNQGRYAEAERLDSEVIEIRKRVLGPEHPDTLSTMHNLALVYWIQNRYPEAERLYSETIEIQKRVLGPEHPGTLSSINKLAMVYLRQGRYSEAERLYSAAHETQKRVLGPDNPITLDSMDGMATVYWYQTRHAEAEALYRGELEIKQRVLGPDHPETLALMNNLANVCFIEHQYAETERLNLGVLEIRKRVLGPEHPDTLSSMSITAFHYLKQGRYAEAERLYSDTLELRKRVLGPRQPATLDSMYDLCCVSALRGDREQAMNRLRQAIDAGYSKADDMVRDSDLKSLHGPEFDKLVEHVRGNATAARLPAADQRKN